MTATIPPYDVESVYALLPAYLRVRDEQLGQELRAAAGDLVGRTAADYAPLRSLVALFADELAALDAGTQRLYDDLFIETCAEWVIPYIGDLVGARLPPDALRDELNPRAIVADVIADRRRKGTIAGLERVADAAVASWVAKATEYWSLLIQTVNLNHLPAATRVADGEASPRRAMSVDVRRVADLREVGTPFDPFMRTVDTRSASDGGRYNVGNVGIDVWRVTSQRRVEGTAHRIGGRRYTFDPFGRDIELYVDPAPLVGTDRVEARHVACPLNRRVLADELASRYGGDVEVTAAGVAPDGSNVEVCLLADDPGNPGNWLNSEDRAETRIDPELGRLVLGDDGGPPAEVDVMYHYGAAAVVGGGSYPRDPSELGTHLAVEHGLDIDELPAVTVAAGAAEPQVLAARGGGVVEITDSRTATGWSTIVADPGAALVITAADGHAPVIAGGPLTIRLFEESTIVLDGLWIDADIEIVKPEPLPATVVFRNSTVVPGRRVMVVGPAMSVHSTRSVFGQVLVSSDTELVAADSVFDGGAPDALAIAATTGASGGVLGCRETTIVGRLLVNRIDVVSNSLLIAAGNNPGGEPPIVVRRRQVGCVRHSYLPFDSVVPRRYRCVPDEDGSFDGPVMRSMRHGDAGYMQLDGRTARSIRIGSDEESEMGVLHRAHQRAREIVLQDRLEEFLRFGMEAGVHYAS